MKEYEQTRCGSLHLEAVIRSLPVRVVKHLGCRSLHLEAVIRPFPVKAAKTFGFLYVGGSWTVESFQFRGT